MSISSDSAAWKAVARVLGACALACSSPDPSEPNEPTYLKIDDMEGTSGRIDWTPEDGAPDALPGRWVSYADVQCDDLEPIPEWATDVTGMWSYAELPEPTKTLSGVTSAHAARLRTTAPLENT